MKGPLEIVTGGREGTVDVWEVRVDKPLVALEASAAPGRLGSA